MRPRSTPFTLTCGDSKNEKGSGEEEGFEVVETELLCAEKHCANELTPRGAEAGAKNDRKTAIIGRTRRALPSSIAGPWYLQIVQRFCARRRRQDVHSPPTARLIPSGEASIHSRAWLH